MAVNEPSASSGGVTELLSGWSFVVHRPSEDPEPSSLPSTVDITAFSTGPSEQQPSNAPNSTQICSDSDSESDTDNSGTEGSGSCSGSSSDSDSSSSSQCTSPRSSPSFNLTSTQTGGLKLKIAAIKKSPDREQSDDGVIEPPDASTSDRSSGSGCTDSDSDTESQSTTTKSDDTTIERNKNPSTTQNTVVSRAKRDTIVSSTNRKTPIKQMLKSNDNKSINNRNELANNARQLNKVKLGVKRRKLRQQTPSQYTKNNRSSSDECDQQRGDGDDGSGGGNTTTTTTSAVGGGGGGGGGDGSESDANSAMLAASCSLQEIRQEDLAAILPDQQECDAFGGFESESRPNKNALINETADNSDSDMELPPQLVNAAIQRATEIASDTETSLAAQPIIYSSSLLQQFEVQTQMLSTTPSAQTNSSGTTSMKDVKNNTTSTTLNNKLSTSCSETNDEKSKRKRGRPKKHCNNNQSAAKQLNPKVALNRINGVQQQVYVTEPNVSPDSGIQESPPRSPPRSPSPAPVQAVKSTKKTTKVFDRILYDRVLYPRRKVGRPPSKIVTKRPGRPPKHKNSRNNLKLKKTLKENKCKHKLSDKDLLQLNSLSLGKLYDNKDDSVCDKTIKSERSTTKKMFFKQSAHHKHHHKHKIGRHRRKDKKPVQIDPKIINDIDKLVNDFIKYCNIGTNNQCHNKIPEIFKCVKRVSKKRKGSDNIDGRKKKKQCNTTTSINLDGKDSNSNEQRLPLKKRHYHVSNGTENISTSSVDSFKSDIDTKTVVSSTNQSNVCNNLLVNDKTRNNNNIVVPIDKTLPNNSLAEQPTSTAVEDDKERLTQDIHIQEAIEACIHKYTAPKSVVPKQEMIESNAELAENKINSPKVLNLKNITATTPKKRHKLESDTQKLSNLESNIKVEPTINNNNETMLDSPPILQCDEHNNKTKKTFTKLLETVAQIKTRKKNRLEDLTSNLVSKITPATEALDSLLINNQRKTIKKVDTATKNRASVIKSPPNRKKLADSLSDLDASIVSDKPTGIFLPTIDIELHIPASTIRTTINSCTDDDEPLQKLVDAHNLSNKVARKRDKRNNKIDSDNIVKKPRSRRRKTINRTGFPTIKKKKKKPPPITNQTDTKDNANNVYERIPRIDELASTFLQRTKDTDDQLRDISPASSVELRKKSNRTIIVDNNNKLKRKRERSLDSLVSCSINHSKRRVRDLSPASSIEPLPCDKRIRPDDSTSASGDEIKKSKKPPRWRKKFLIAGLFSDYYKEDEPRKSEQLSAANKNKLIYRREEHQHGLLPPPYHCGKWLRCRRQHFQLPYDIWWQHTHSKLPSREVVPSWNYKKIRTNVYCVRATSGACEPQACNCTESSGCGDDCINRLVLAECPATHRCKNQRIQKHDWAPGLDKFMTEDKGWGVRTKLPIKSGEFILEYVGEVVSDQEFKQRMASRYAFDTHHYCLHLDGGLVIDGHRMGGDGRFVNHSCQPNCEMQKWSVNGQFRMALFALRDIQPYEELTYDYNFSLFNPAEGQVCKCNSENCRGVIGGKSQRVKQPTTNNTRSSTPQEVSTSNTNGGRVGRPRKNQARRTTTGSKDSGTDKSSNNCPIISSSANAAAILPQMKPLTNQQKSFVAEHHCFLLKNLGKVKKIRDRSASLVSRSSQALSETTIGSAFINHLNALRQPRNVRTRRLAQAEGDPELTKTARLAEIFRELWTFVVNAKDEKNEMLSAPFITLPSKRKMPEYYQKITEPIDLSTVEQNINNGQYRTVEMFDNDMNRLIDNAVKFYHRTSELGIAATRLRKVYGEAKLQSLNRLKDILGEKPPADFVAIQNPGGEEEDVIRCICGLYRDEGLMIQCERCMVWQHCECVKADVNAPSYHCERCQPRDVDYEIPLDEFTEHGHRYYLSLMRGDLQLRQGDTVYVLRDIAIEGTDKKHTYETIGDIDYSELDIFRIERLWKDKDTGKRMAYGHHYLRPHETYHEPTRKFFTNEVMRVPLYEAVPVELIMSKCWVLDINTYCKGRPIGAPEQHIYICEYRVDKGARLFSKISSKSQFPTCTKSYAFEKFETRLKVSRTYAPHDVEQEKVVVKSRNGHGRRGTHDQDDRKIESRPITLHVPIMRTREEKRNRLNGILLKLLGKLPVKQTLDVSYLLEAGRRRKKVQS